MQQGGPLYGGVISLLNFRSWPPAAVDTRPIPAICRSEKRPFKRFTINVAAPTYAAPCREC